MLKKQKQRKEKLGMKMYREKRKEYQVTQLAKPGRSSEANQQEASKNVKKKEARRNTVKAADKVLSAKIKNIPHPRNQSNCTFRSNQASLTPVPSSIPVPAPAPAPPPLPAVQYLLYQQQAMHLGSKILFLSRCMNLKVYIYTWQRCLTSQRMKRKPI